MSRHPSIRFRPAAGGAAAILLACLAPLESARADMPDAQVVQNAYSYPSYTTTHAGGTVSTYSCSPGGDGVICGGGTSTVSLQDGVSFVSVTASSSGIERGTPAASFANIGQAFSSMNYWFEVDGPVGTTIPVVFSATQTSSGSGSVATNSPNSETRLVLYEYGVGDVSDTYTCLGDPGACSPTSAFGNKTSVDTSLSFSVSAGTDFEVIIQTLAEVGVGGAGGGRYTATVDPSVAFAAGFDTSGYSFAYPANVGDPLPSPVPEPAALTLMMAGLLVVASRKRARPQAPSIRAISHAGSPA